MKRRLADVAAYGCSTLLVLGVIAFVVATIVGWARAPREDLWKFLGWTRLLIVGSLILGALLHGISSRPTSKEIGDVLRRTWRAGLHPGNLVRGYLLIVVLMLLVAAVVAVTPFRLPYAFYTVLRVVTCLAWIILLIIVILQRCDGDGELALLSITFLFTFTPVWPLHLARSTWAVIDLIAAGTLLITVVTLSRYPTRSTAAVSETMR